MAAVFRVGALVENCLHRDVQEEIRIMAEASNAPLRETMAPAARPFASFAQHLGRVLIRSLH